MTTTKARSAAAAPPAGSRWRCLVRPCNLRARWQPAADSAAAQESLWWHYRLMHRGRP
ncbi:hypothetical protein [Nonomuraea sp. JJY05]|uniref:hypothetical protein n=1 Tax=Nonomuraea sp. JJY05 TaxID=3350255 RepID=UPI00373F3B0D